MKRVLLVAMIALAGATSLSCNVNQYCLNCDKGDGGPADANGDAADAGSGSGSGSGSCTPSPEICDGSDNDCDGIIDEGPLTDPGIGSACPNQMGDCAGGKLACIHGAVKCDKLGSAEICDGRDNDCDGVIDNGDPGDGVTIGGSKCGTDVGECVAGTNHCVNGAMQCIGRINGSAEICNAKDDDCDGQFDEDLTNLGTCGSSSVGACHLGALQCQGGTVRCVGAQDPTFESCNNIDDDCDGSIDEDFNLATDPQNCGMCGNVCNLPNAFPGCANSACTIAACQSGFHDNNHNPVDGCEFGPCTITGAEVCNGVDDDCDGVVDDHLGAPPAICATKGACAGTTAQCDGSAGYECHYGPNVSTDGNFNIIPETLCDGIDNDCNGIIDDNQPNVGQPCHDNKLGACQSTGHFACDASNPNGPAICIIDHPGIAPSPETCDNIDNDCDGVIDNGAGSGNILGQEWISLGNNTQMMKYEASRPDANATTVGSVGTTVCSKPNAQPWVDVKYPDAVAACAEIGATLCTEQQWHRECSVIAPTTYPIVLPTTGTQTALVEAEDYFAISPSQTADALGIHSWVEDYATDGNGRTFSGISDMQAIPDNGENYDITATDIRTVSPHLDYQFKVQTAGTFHVWVLINAPNGNGNRVAVAFDGAQPNNNNNNRISSASTNTWVWLQTTNQFALGVGTHTLNVYMMRDGTKIDAIEITTGTATPALPTAPAGNTWSYATNPNTAQTGVCNDHNFSATDDNVIPTGTDTNCHTSANVFDMSGNVKEWVLAHQPGQNPIRGGASNNLDTGTTCALNFTLADNTFFFPNVGFRCCRIGP